MAISVLIVLLALVAPIVGTEILCRDPDLGGQSPASRQKRKFLLIGGDGNEVEFFIFDETWI
jgi:hypothetical protein